MKKRIYENDDDYILNILELEQDKLTGILFKNINDENLLYALCSFLAVKKRIEEIRYKKYKQHLKNKFHKI
jgi:hypothetical protein